MVTLELTPEEATRLYAALRVCSARTSDRGDKELCFKLLDQIGSDIQDNVDQLIPYMARLK